MKHKNVLRKICAVSLAAVMIVGGGTVLSETSLPGEITANAASTAESGKCGENLTYTLDSDGTLTISGTGDMDGHLSTFHSNNNIKKVIIKNGVTNISESAFYKCINLSNVTISNSVTSIDTWAFGNCIGLKNISIPNSVTSIGERAFHYCTGLTSITLPNSIANIGVCSFEQCTKLRSITIPNSVTSIDDGTFYGCTGLTNINIPDSVKSIGKYAFCSCSKLKSITIPNSVITIGKSAFSECSELINISISNSVTNIGDGAFTGCASLKNITIPNNVTEIKKYAFGYNTLYSVKTDSIIYEKISGFTITGTKGSVAEKYAKDNGFTFKEIASSVTKPTNNGSKLVNNQGQGGVNISTWVNWNNITAKANFKGEGGWKYKYSYKNDKDNKWVDMTGYVTSNSYRLPKFTTAGNYTIRIAAIDKYGQYASKYTYLTVKQDSKKALKDNGTKLSAITVSKGQTITISSKFTGGVVPYRYKYAYRKNGGAWVAIAQPKHDNTTGYSTDDNFSFKLPSQSGKYTVKVVCRDGAGKTCSKDINVTVK